MEDSVVIEICRDAMNALLASEPKFNLIFRDYLIELSANAKEVALFRIHRAFALYQTNNLRDRIFRRDRNHHLNVVRHQVPPDSAFLLPGQFNEHLAEVLLQLRVQRLSALRNENNMIFALPLAAA
jgi:hypothetical protein